MNSFFVKEKVKIRGRMLVVYVLLAIFFGVLLVNLINLQVVKGNENLLLSSTIKTSEVVVRAPRGLVYDREDNLLVSNKPSFKLIVEIDKLPQEKEEEVVKILAEILEVKYENLWEDFSSKVYESEDKRTTLSEVILLNNVDRDKVLSISSKSDQLPGIYTEVGTTREYRGGESFGHLLGYVREVTSSELEEGNYSIGDSVGEIGLEQYYDETLRGVNGKRILESDRDDAQVRELVPINAISGESIKLSIDSDMQEKMGEFLKEGIEKNNADGGAAVIMDIHTGEILTLASMPSFDPNEIVGGLSYSEYLSLSNDPKLPLYNRAISMTQPPGSTFKIIVGSVALQEGVISTDQLIECNACKDLGNGYEFCEVGKAQWGKINILQAYERSSNIFFGTLNAWLGIDKSNEYQENFGLGQKTGIDLVGEQPGIIASPETKEAIQGEPWYLGDTYNTGIGQGLTKVSPIQMVSWISAIANGGTIYKPHLVTSVLDESGDEIQKTDPEIIHTLPVDDSNLSVVREGMYQVVNGRWGSAWLLRGSSLDPAAKTGSAEALRKVGDGEYEMQGHSWITGFYPYEEPKYAFVVYLEFGGWGYKSAKVMRNFLDWQETQIKN
jgi:penicillin-binding protein 2